MHEDILLMNSWDISLITDEYQTHKIEKGISNIKVAIVDSGIDMEHPGLNTVVNKSVSIVDSYPNVDFTGHGTMVAGQIAGNGMILGIAPNIKLYSYKIFDRENKSKLSYLIKALQLCMEDNVHIINMSLGFYLEEEAKQLKELKEIFRELRSRDIICISSVGYGNKTGRHYPSSLNTVLSCQSLCKNNKKVNKGVIADYCLPSGDYLNNFADEIVSIYNPINLIQTIHRELNYPIGYSFMNGESLSSAKLTGLVAIAQSYYYRNNNKLLNCEDMIKLLNKNSSIIDGSYKPKLLSILENIKGL